MAIDDAARAGALVGVPFRPQGRVPDQGLDCVGLVLSACGLPADLVQANYRLRGDHRAELTLELLRFFRRVDRGQRQVGDIVLMAVAGDQMHLGVFTGLGFVHADARLRKVVETPGEPEWPVIGIYRRRTRLRKH